MSPEETAVEVDEIGDRTSFAFRRLATDDLPLMHRWLNTPHVQEWYIDEPTEFDEVAATYAPNPALPTERYLILLGDRPIGYIQTYFLADYLDYAVQVAAPEEIAGLAGVDIFIGEADCIHRGLGTQALRAFLREVIFGRNGATACQLDPDPANRAAIRCYEKVGFRHIRTVQVPDSPVPSYVMRVRPEDLEAMEAAQL
jgi:RimJ/RimL family protein N-acetyltransferase